MLQRGPGPKLSIVHPWAMRRFALNLACSTLVFLVASIDAFVQGEAHWIIISRSATGHIEHLLEAGLVPGYAGILVTTSLIR